MGKVIEFKVWVFDSWPWKLKRHGPIIDNVGFRLYSRTTVIILFILDFYAFFVGWWGGLIHCLIHGIKDDERTNIAKAVAHYCYIQGTYTLHDKNITHGHYYAEFGALQGIRQPFPEEEITYHNYYIWVPHIIFLQLLAFRFPHFIWKNMEGGFLAKLLNKVIDEDLSLRINTLKTPDTDKWRRHMEGLAKALLAYRHHGLNQFYAMGFVFCEFLNFLVVMMTMWLTDMFLGGEFRTYTIDVFKHILTDDPYNRTDPLNLVFPKATKCLFRTFGPGGGLQNRDAFCVIGINLFNERMFVVLWLWYLLLLIISCFIAAYRATVIVSPVIRARILRSRVFPSEKRFVNSALAGEEGEPEGLGYSDWFILKRISDNVNPKRFGEICWYIYKELPESVKIEIGDAEEGNDGAGGAGVEMKKAQVLQPPTPQEQSKKKEAELDSDDDPNPEPAENKMPAGGGGDKK